MINCPECNKPLEGMCEECGVTFEKQELIVTDLHNYVAKPQRFYKRGSLQRGPRSVPRERRQRHHSRNDREDKG